MKEAKLTLLLRSFSKEEFKEFGIFLNSPYFITNKKLAVYYNILFKYHPELEYRSLSNEMISEKLYPGKKFNIKQIKYLNTEMIKAAEMYLGISEYMNNKPEQMLSEMKQLGRKELDTEFNRKASDMKELLETSEKRSSDFYLVSYLLKKEERNFNEVKKSLGKRTEYFDVIKDELDEFILYTVIVMLKYYVILKNHKVHLNKEYDYSLISEYMSYAEKNLIDKYPVVKTFYLLNLMFDNDKDENIFYNVKQHAQKYNGIFEKEDAELIYTAMFNYTKLKYLDGLSKFSSENASILKYMILNNLYPRENGYMSQNTYLNAVSTGLLEKDYSWVEEFIKKYTDMVTTERRSNVCNYSMGTLHYRKKEYSPALDYFSKVKIEDFYYYIRVKNHLMKIYFETNDIDGLLVTIDSFKHFISTHDEIPEMIRERFKTYINYLHSIINAKEKGDDFKLKSIKEKIKSSSEFENRAWLLEQLETIKV